MWILIAITIASGPIYVSGYSTTETPHVSSVEFSTLRACYDAANQIRKSVDSSRLRLLCVSKGGDQSTAKEVKP